MARAADGALNATDAGIHPGSPDDQSEAFRQALTQAAQDGRELFLPPGDYRVAGVTLPPAVRIFGMPGKSRLVFAGGPFMLAAEQGQTLRIFGITFDGDGKPLDPDMPALLYADDVADIGVDDCAFQNSAAAGLIIRAAAGRVERCRVSAVRTVGIELQEARGMRVTGNALADCGDTGILVAHERESEDGTIVSENRVSRIRAESGGTGQNGNGINLDKANGVIVADNRIDQCAFSAIRCFSSDSVKVTGNIATRSGETAVYVEFASEGAVVADNLIDGGANGISFANFAEHGGRLSTCSGNIVRNLTGGPRYADGNPLIGYGIAAEADTAVTGNLVENAVWGLKLGWGPYLRDVAATGNVIRRTKIGIAVSVVEGGGPALISGNLITGAEEGAILGLRWEEVATGELAGGEEDVEGVRIEGNVVG
jgi:uncharacterized secreted repeat protein (TIGR03808 family)